jgi:hypothetical protein
MHRVNVDKRVDAAIGATTAISPSALNSPADAGATVIF